MQTNGCRPGIMIIISLWPSAVQMSLCAPSFAGREWLCFKIHLVMYIFFSLIEKLIDFSLQTCYH